MKHNFKITTLSAAIMATFIGMPTYAAEAEQLSEAQQRRVDKAAVQKKAEIEVIEVTGFAGSLRKAMNAKRFSDGVGDSIHAEDVGKSTDANIADALSRVTGVTVSEQDGEGTRISIRGSSSAFNQISMNGVALTSGANGSGNDAVSDQSVDLSSFSSDILSSIDVQKTSAADQDEGSLGASVVLRTVRPLNLNKSRRTLQVEGRYNEFSDDTDRRISGSFSEKLLDETLGFIVTYTDETQATRVDQYISAFNASVRNNPAGRIRDSKTGEVISDMAGSPFSATDPVDYIARSLINYRLNQNQRDRQTATAGFQYMPTDTTEIMLDLNYSKQDVSQDYNNLQAQMVLGRPNQAGDPQQDWWTLDQSTNVLSQRFDRRGRSKITRSIGGIETENKVASLNIQQQLTDSFSADLTFGYSRTESNTKPNAQLLLNSIQRNDQFIPLEGSLAENEEGIIATLEAGGYNCAGDFCSYVPNSGEVQYAPLPGLTNASSLFTRGQGSNALNPNDTLLYRGQTLTQFRDETTDENKSVFLDFDWDLDGDIFTTVEFGAKWANRHKVVDTNNVDFTNSNPIVDDASGEDVQAEGLSVISFADVVTDEAFAYDNFLEGFQTNNSLKEGWGVIDPFKAFAVLTSGQVDPSQVRLRVNKGNSRDIEQETTAAYAKVNFELLDGKLTGNIGMRYVKTKTDAKAYGTVNFQNGPQSYDPYELFYERQLANTSLPQCQYDTSTTVAPENCSDFNLLFNYDAADPTSFPALDTGGFLVNPGLANAQQGLVLSYDVNGNVTGILRNDAVNNIGRNVDANGAINLWSDPTTDVAAIVPGTGQTDPQANSRLFLASDSASQTNLLPSLNLNYALDDETVIRFAISKTMARPIFDDLRPGGALNEGLTVSKGNGTINNTQLKPLESKNIDFSYEWYFNESSLLSVALFYKEMTGLVQGVTDDYIMSDIRDNRVVVDEDGIASIPGVGGLASLLHLPTASGSEAGGLLGLNQDNNWAETPLDTLEDGSTCLPNRIYRQFWEQEINFGCRTFAVQQRVNGQRSVQKGIELNYTQNYDFLPGLFSGLGMNFNYTYVNSKNDAEVSSSGIKQVPLPQTQTPKHSANTTLFWEKDGLMFRLASRYNGVSLIDEDVLNGQGATWLDATHRLDFSSSYVINENVTVTFQATNLTDDVRKVFLTSKSFSINGEVINEGNALDGNVTKDRVVNLTQTGRQFRLGVRATF